MFAWRTVLRQIISSNQFLVRKPIINLTTDDTKFIQKHYLCMNVCLNKFNDELHKVKKFEKELVELKEEDLSEYQVRGSGGGGQKTNKTANCIVLSHVPTGLSVRVHESRSVLDNKKIARAKLRLQVDSYVRGDESVLAREQKRNILRKQSGKRQAEKRLEGKSKLKAIIEKDDDIKY